MAPELRPFTDFPFPMNTMDSRNDKLTGILRGHLRFLGEGDPLDPDASLAELGLDSLGVIDLLVEIEEAFEVTLPDELITAESFSTANHILALVDQAAAPNS